MGKKIKVNITGMTINAPTYKNVSVTPTMINFFYGKNGTGKSTLAKAFKDGNAELEWDGQPYHESRVLVYNEDFITRNVQSYGNIPGVFTISEVNAQKKKEADEKAAEKKAVDEEIRSKRQEITAADQNHSSEETNYREAVWKLSAVFREKFPSALAYLRDKKKFVGKVEDTCPKRKKSNGAYYDEEDMSFSSPADDEPEPISIEEIQKLYDTVFSRDEQPSYSNYQLLGSIPIPSSPLLEKPIISQSNTDFAKFIRALGNLDWITSGHEKYHTDGICPYCQRELPATFENDLAACYDKQYRGEIAELQKFVQSYKTAMNNIYVAASGNCKNPFPTNFKDTYKTKFDLFMEKAHANVAILDRKLSTPSDEVEIEDISHFLAELDEIAADINDDINSRREVLADIPKQRKRCSDMTWRAIGQRARVEINTYRHNEASYQRTVAGLNKAINDLRSKSSALATEITKLNSETVNTTKAMEDINAAIRNAGFKGFFLREKPGAKYVYQLVRDFDGRQDVVDKYLFLVEMVFLSFM